MNYLIDTNVVSELRKGKQANRLLIDWFGRRRPQEIFLSVLTLGELRHGVERIRRRHGVASATTLARSFRTRASLTGSAMADLASPRTNPARDARASWDRVIDLLAFLTAVYHLVVVGRTFIYLGIFYPTPFHRAVSLTFALLMAYLLHMRRRDGRNAGFRVDLGLLVMLGFIIPFYEQVTDYDEYGFLDLAGMALAFSLAISLLVALKRAVGWVLVTIICLFLAVARYQNILPGLLFGKGYAWDRLTYAVYVPGEGIFGVPLGVASTIVIVFLMFAHLLQKAGVGEWFSELAMALAALSALAGAVSLSAGTIGYGLVALTWPVRAILIAGGVLLILPGWNMLGMGSALVVAGVLLQFRRVRAVRT